MTTPNVVPYLIITCIIFISQLRRIESQEVVSVQVEQAVVNGIIEGRNGQREYYAFKGIQYATAERWKDPILKELVGKEYNASKFGQKCPQWSKDQGRVIGEEDCLYLNIFTKVLPDNSRTRGGEILNPVMFYLHGGGFTFGSGELAGPRRFMTAEEKVVLVSVNSRLGVFGFLSTGEKDLAGNWGLLDQLVALEWMHKYIQHFGGDPQRITIFGHSSGAASAHFLTLSPRLAGKFHSAILHSGNGLCEAHFEKQPLKYVEKVATLLQCPIEHRSELLHCLHNQSRDALIKSQEDLVDFWIYPKHAVPVVDGGSRGSLAIIADTPSILVDTGKINPIPIIIGVNKDEGLLGFVLMHQFFGHEKFRNTSAFTSQILPRVLRALLKIEKDEDIQSLLDLVQEHYFKNLNVTDEKEAFESTVTEQSNLIGDLLYYSCERDFLERYARLPGNPVYSYVFSHKTPTSPSIISKELDAMKQQNISHHLFDFGVSHLEDMFYLFDPNVRPPGTRPQVFSSVDERVAAAYTRSLITFAKNGTPVPSHDPTNAWLPIKSGTLHYFNFTSVPVWMGLDFRKQESLFWLRTVPYVRAMGNYTTEMSERLRGTEATLNSFQILFWVAMTLVILLLIALIFLGMILWRKRTTGNAALG